MIYFFRNDQWKITTCEFVLRARATPTNRTARIVKHIANVPATAGYINQECDEFRE